MSKKIDKKAVISTAAQKDFRIPQVRKQKEDIQGEREVPSLEINNSFFCGCEWMQLEPKGIVFEGHHFVLILEDKSQKLQLPVRFPLQSGDMISVANMASIWKKSLTTITDKLLPLMDLKLKRCVFIPEPGENHRVKIFFIKEGIETFFESEFDRVLGLCLDSKLPFYATRAYIQQAKVNGADSEIFLQNQRWTDGRQKYLM